MCRDFALYEWGGGSGVGRFNRGRSTSLVLNKHKRKMDNS